MDRLIALAHARFFQGLSEDSRKALAAVCVAREVKRRAVLFREGDPGGAVYVLGRGAVQLYRTGPDGSEVVIRVIPPGEVFGEVILFERDRYPVSAVALEDSFLFLIPKRDLLGLLGREEFRNDFIAMLMRKQRYLTERIYDLTQRDAEERLLRFLRQQFGAAPAVEVTLSKKDIAAAIDTTPETISRLIRKLDRRGVLTWRGRSLRWKKPAKDS